MWEYASDPRLGEVQRFRVVPTHPRRFGIRSVILLLRLLQVCSGFMLTEKSPSPNSPIVLDDHTSFISLMPYVMFVRFYKRELLRGYLQPS